MNRFAGRAWVAVAGVAIVLAMTHVADAQRGGGGRGPFGRGFGGGGFGITLADLARADEVQAALKLSDEQEDKIAEINEGLRQSRRELFRQGGDLSEMRAEMQKLNEESTAKLAEVLDETQNKRLLGILAQVDVYAALNNPTIAKELNVTDEQKEKVAEIRDTNRDAMRGIWDLSLEERTAKMEELRAEAGKKMLAALTSDQQAQYEALKGEPVKVDMSQLFMFGRRGGGRGLGGRDGGGRGNRGGDGGASGSAESSSGERGT